MRWFILLAMVLSLSASAFAFTPSTSNVHQCAQKPMGSDYQDPTGPRVHGDTIADPFIMGAIPFTATGSTVGFVNDYDYACPYTGSTAPDVVYKYVCTSNMVINAGLCASIFDTKLYIYANALGTPIACNDDYCQFQSQVSNVPLLAGNTYYIVVDGYGGSCGTYTLTVDTYCCCVLECPPGAMLEGEPTCYAGYDDQYNGGCNTLPFPVFQILSEWADDPIVICGTTGVFMMDTMTYRDTDWYQMDVTSTSYICLSGDSEISSYFFIIDGRGGCSGSVVVAYGIAGPCVPVADICYTCDPGTWWAWAGPSSWDLSYACGSVYVMTISGYAHDGSPVESTTWGRIKGLFR